MAIDTTSPRTRRAILLGALGGAFASVAAAVGRASQINADDGEPMLVGHTYSSTSPTKINATGVTAIWATSDSLAGVYGSSTSNVGVEGDSYSAIGVIGSSQGGVGVRGSSAVEKGVFGITSAFDQPAILGWSHRAQPMLCVGRPKLILQQFKEHA